MLEKSKENKHWLNPELIVCMLILLTFIIRLSIYYTTTLFSFSDYAVYLNGIERINNGERIFLLDGNFLFTISYIGYFAKYILGSLDWFFVFNCLVGSITGYFLFILVRKIFASTIAGLITCGFLLVYSEFLVYSSVFYTPVLMIFLVTIFTLLLYYYYIEVRFFPLVLITLGLIIIFLITFFFKWELKYFPIFMLILSFLFFKKNKIFFQKTLTIAILLLVSNLIFNKSGIISHTPNHIYSNDFIFFGHTNYGGDGGEGSFVYHKNEIRYNKALTEWCEKNKIVNPDQKEINKFKREEVIKFIAHSPFSWIKLQLIKFFRTFGVVPETGSFKILYTGLFKEKLWLTSIIVVAPVALIVLFFITFFNFSSIKKLFNPSTLQPFNSSTLQPFNPSTLQQPHPAHRSEAEIPFQRDPPPHTGNNNFFIYIYFLLFFYYIIATVFYGQYQERYRLPVMVVFIIPVLSYFIASFNRKQFFNRISLSIKCMVIVLFMTVWVFQAKKAISNKERLKNAIESVGGMRK